MSDSAFASLGPSLLARKGGAKPAMRPQVAPLVAPLDTGDQTVPEEQLEDLGWNDMGDPDHESGAEIVPISAAIASGPTTAGPGPIMRRQRRRLEERVLADAAMTGPEDREAEYEEAGEDCELAALYGEEDYGEDATGTGTAIHSPLATSAKLAAERSPAKSGVSAIQSDRRAAFTLRLDAARHLKLRLAATMQGVSAQALVTEALDRLLAEHDELDVIANHLKRH
jgi:hypothetical protein